jgi:hypothetical protein
VNGPLTQHDIETRIEKLMEELETHTERFEALSVDAAEAEADYRAAVDNNIVGLVSNHTEKMTAQERTARAGRAAQTEHRTFLMAVARRNSCREYLLSLRDMLAATRTLAANVRNQT